MLRGVCFENDTEQILFGIWHLLNVLRRQKVDQLFMHHNESEKMK